MKFTIKAGLLAMMLALGINTPIFAQQPCDEGYGNLAIYEDILLTPEGALRSCQLATARVEWTTFTESGQSYDADFHVPKINMLLPNQLEGLSGTLEVSASDGQIYWDPNTILRLTNEVQVPLQGVIPSGVILSIKITDMDVSMEDPGEFLENFFVSQSISKEAVDCIFTDDNQTITRQILRDEGPEITSMEADCTADELGVEITVAPGPTGAIESYMWNGPNGFTSTEEDPSANIAETVAANESASGDYTVIVTDENGCEATETITLDETNCEELPVRYSRFTAEAQGKDGLLNWVTSSEINNDRFEIERSFDGINYAYIGEVAGNGTTNIEQSYDYVDVAVGGLTRTSGKKVYYRLNQKDFDGKSTLSGVRVITFDGEEGAMTIYPNPASNYTVVDLGSVCENCTLKVYNTVGQEVESLSYQGAMSIDTKSITPGSYMVNIIDESGAVKGAHRLITVK